MGGWALRRGWRAAQPLHLVAQLGLHIVADLRLQLLRVRPLALVLLGLQGSDAARASRQCDGRMDGWMDGHVMQDGSIQRQQRGASGSCGGSCGWRERARRQAPRSGLAERANTRLPLLVRSGAAAGEQVLHAIVLLVSHGCLRVRRRARQRWGYVGRCIVSVATKSPGGGGEPKSRTWDVCGAWAPEFDRLAACRVWLQSESAELRRGARVATGAGGVHRPFKDREAWSKVQRRLAVASWDGDLQGQSTDIHQRFAIHLRLASKPAPQGAVPGRGRSSLTSSIRLTTHTKHRCINFEVQQACGGCCMLPHKQDPAAHYAAPTAPVCIVESPDTEHMMAARAM